MFGEALVAAVTGAAVVLAAWLTSRGARKRADAIHDDLANQMDTGNGHTLGAAVSNLENQARLMSMVQQEQVAALQSVDRRVTEQGILLTRHLEEVTPLLSEHYELMQQQVEDKEGPA